MSILECARLASKLINEKKYHTERRGYYSKLFNDSCPDIEGVSEENGICWVVSPIQNFYQMMCEFHASCEAKIDAAIIQFCELPD